MAGMLIYADLMRSATRYITIAEKENAKAIRLNSQIEDKINRLDSLRRGMLYVERGYEDLKELSALLVEIEELRDSLSTSKMRLKVNLASSVGYLVSMFKHLPETTSLPLPKMSGTLRQAVLIVRTSKDLCIDYSELASLSAQCDTFYKCIDRNVKTSMSDHFFNQIKLLQNVIG